MWKKVILMLILVLGTIPTPKINGQVHNLVNTPIPDINYKILYQTIVLMGIKFPDIVFAQSILESGHFKSNLAKTNNNIFGMKLPKVRETTAIGKGKSGYAKYESWIHSVEDYSYWQNHMVKNDNISRSEYFYLLGKVYATDKNYVSRLKRKIIEYKHLMV
jgi:hypothetical protein